MHYRLKVYFYVAIILNFCKISQINIYSNALEKIKKNRRRWSCNQRELCPAHDLVHCFTVTIKIQTYIPITKARYFAGRHRNWVRKEGTSWFNIIILLPQDGTKRLKISAFLGSHLKQWTKFSGNVIHLTFYLVSKLWTSFCLLWQTAETWRLTRVNEYGENKCFTKA